MWKIRRPTLVGAPRSGQCEAKPCAAECLMRRAVPPGSLAAKTRSACLRSPVDLAAVAGCGRPGGVGFDPLDAQRALDRRLAHPPGERVIRVGRAALVQRHIVIEGIAERPG